MDSSPAPLEITRNPGRRTPLPDFALPGEEAEIGRRLGALDADLKPRSELGRYLVGRVALMMTRLGRSAEHEAKSLAYSMRKAREGFAEARLAEVDELVAWILRHPETNARRLRAMPEGVERLIKEIRGLRDDLAHPHGYRWDFDHADRLLSFLGRRYSDLPIHRIRALTQAIEGDFKHLEPDDRPDLDRESRKLWALRTLVYLIDAEIEALEALRVGMDLDGLELDRAEAAARAMFDGSKEGVLARKYESANERSLFRALREFRLAESEVEVVPKPAVGEDLGSFFPEPPSGEDGEANADPIKPGRGDFAAGCLEGRPKPCPKPARCRCSRPDRPAPGPGRA